MKMNKFLIPVFPMLFFIFFSCKKQDNISRLSSDGNAPGPVTNVVVTNKPGGAIFTYTIPSDPDLLYVEAAYRLADGNLRTVNSSFNKNYLEVEGFADTTDFKAELTAVDKSGNRSSAVQVTFRPQTPPILLVEKSLQMSADFGGVNYQWDNAAGTPIALLLFSKDVTGASSLIDTYYSDAKVGNFTLRGQDTVTKDYMVVLRDKWGNLSDSITARLSPLYEVLLDRAQFRDLGDVYRFNMGGNNLNALWNNNREDNATGSTTIPWNGAMDLGVKAKLSRIVIWQYSWPFNNYGHYYAGGNAREILIYGSNAPAASNQIGSTWTLMKDCDIVKRSGLPIGIGRTMMSDEDYDIARNRGHEFVVPLDKEAVRYIMINVIRGWESTLGAFSEIQFYGQPQ